MSKRKTTNRKLRLISSRSEPATRKSKFVETFKEVPQKPNTFTVDDALEKISAVGGGS